MGRRRNARKLKRGGFFSRGNVIAFTVLLGLIGLAFAISALMHWLSPSFPIWGAGFLGVVSAPFIAFCVVVVMGDSEYSAYQKLLLCSWAALTFGIAALVHRLSPWFPTWAAAGLFGTVLAPVISPLALLLPEPIPSGGQLNARDHLGKTPLMLAAENGDLRRVKALIAKGADVNAKDHARRRTALMEAASSGSVDCVQALIAAGADVNAKDHVGNTALRQNRYKSDIAAILQSAGAVTPSEAPSAASTAPAASSEPSSSPQRPLADDPTAARNSPETNLSRWKASGNPEEWVRQRNLQWSHQDWLDLLASLRRSDFWPMEPDEIGRVLEEQKNVLTTK